MKQSIKKLLRKLQFWKTMKDWSTLEKGDTLHLLVPFDDGHGSIKYLYQESQVINVHKYDWCTNVRFKYTDIGGKRRRLELGVNKTKYHYDYISADSRTSWAREVPIKYSDMIVTFKDKEYLNKAFEDIIENEIKKVEEEIDKNKKKLSELSQLKYERFV